MFANLKENQRKEKQIFSLGSIALSKQGFCAMIVCDGSSQSVGHSGVELFAQQAVIWLIIIPVSSTNHQLGMYLRMVYHFKGGLNDLHLFWWW